MSENVNNSSEDERINDDILENEEKQDFKSEYNFHSYVLNDIDSSNKFVTKEVDNSNATFESKNNIKTKCMEKPRHFRKHKYLSTVKHRQHENITGQKLDTAANNSMKLNLSRSSDVEYRHNQTYSVTQRRSNILKQKIQSENSSYYYFDKSESDDEEEKLSKTQIETDKADYIHLPAYDMENILVEDTSKF